jgi:peptidoglycan hydrolase-like protein with peptidoglycan-binding domain
MASRTYSSRGNAVVHHPMPGLIGLWRKVGNGGANRADDTLAVQVALNAVPVPLGGPEAPLKVDGKVGPKTVGAIRRFQQYWTKVVDGRVDPGGPTVRMLNELAGVPLPHRRDRQRAIASGPAASSGTWAPQRVQVANAGKAGPKPATSNPDLNKINAAIIRMDQIRHVHLPALQHVLDRAMPQLQQAMRHAHKLAIPPVGPAAKDFTSRDNPDRLCFLVVAKHLHLSEKNSGQALEAMDHMIGLVRTMRATVTERQTATGAMSDADDIYVSLYRQPPGDTHSGHTYFGGRWQKEGRKSGRVAVGLDGKPMPERVDRIYIHPVFDGMNQDVQRHVLLHELLHYCGELPASRLRIADHAYAYQPHYRTLTHGLRKANTDTLAMLLLEFALGTQMAARGGQTRTEVIGDIPHVEFDGLITVPDLAPGQADPVAFPASFPLKKPH